ncbi:hypothetical protein EDB62_109113 [Vibrio crassostreae]|nr:hypothetical protein [Vibrio crassostreae]TCN76490.1 hypothetical protein EDB62_109113 [Vibrio crassostreae]TWD67338.1 hypothetical protein FB445_109113 [Vibrio crassostreae]
MDAKHDGIIAVKESLSESGMTIPFLIRTLDIAPKGGKSLSRMMTGAVDEVS